MQAGGGTKSSVLGIKACLEHAEEGSGVQVMTLQEIGGVGVVLWRGEERGEKKIERCAWQEISDVMRIRDKYMVSSR